MPEQELEHFREAAKLLRFVMAIGKLPNPADDARLYAWLRRDQALPRKAP